MHIRDFKLQMTMSFRELTPQRTLSSLFASYKVLYIPRAFHSENDILAHIQSDCLLTTDFLEIDTESAAKSLGVRWKATSNEVFFVPPDLAMEISPRKRQVLFQIAKLFSPAGWLAPFDVCFQIFMQQIWLQDLG